MKPIELIKIIIAGSILSTISFFSYSQKSGVYKNFADYTSGNMEYGIDCAVEKHKNKPNDFHRILISQGIK